MQTATTERPDPALPMPTSRPLVVVLEDDFHLALALQMLIDDWGFEGVKGRSLAEAARTLGSRLTNVSAIVTDLNLNGAFRGIKDAKLLAAAVGRPVPTIVTTGYGDFAEEAGSFPVLRKPFDPNILRKWLDYRVRDIDLLD
jgi:DNA-binding NtrC family response regulator